MTQGVFVDGKRPKSKKAVREATADNPRRVHLEATSIFGNEYDGSLADAPLGEYFIVGPDPARARNFFGHIVKEASGKIVVM